ncbi:hypothetical protein ACWGB8_18805 [Kitasatospora sp. NPDC054939]
MPSATPPHRDPSPGRCRPRAGVRRALVPASVLVAAAAVLGGCAGAPAKPGRPSAAAIVPPPTGPVATPSAEAVAAELHLPIEQFMLTPLQSVQFDWVRKAATGSCMKRYGLKHPVPAQPGPDSPGTAAFTVMNRRYGITDAESAARWGYHVPRLSGDAPAADRPIALSALPVAAQTALLGIDPARGSRVTSFRGRPMPEGGCFAELDRVLPGAAGGPQGPGSGLQGVVTDIKAASFTESRSAPEVVAAVTAWAGCMKEQGFDTPDPLKAPAAVPSMKDPDPSAAEIAQAVADAGCKRRTNLAGIWFAAESTLQNAAITRRANELATVKASLEAERAALTRLLGHDWSSSEPARP